VNFGLHWVRRRQRALARGVLALFCAAWLQAAIVPCVMAHASEAASPPQGQAHHSHDAHAGHDHDAMASPPDTDAGAPPCVYCPPGQAGDSCDGHGGCAYPHDPQVDARAAGALFTALPVSLVLAAPAASVVADRANHRLPAAIPRVSLSVSYCRFIE